MTAQPHLDANRRHDFVLFFDVTDGNPNGDPDADNMPRVDPETMQGLVTDVALKRRVRNYVNTLRGGEEHYKIYVLNEPVALNTKHQRAYTALGITPLGTKQPSADIDRTRAWMCENFYDIRTFGAVMTTGVNCGQVRGPIQLTFGRSVDPIMPLDVSITRVAVTKEGDLTSLTSQNRQGHVSGKTGERGRKNIVPYGLYRSHGFFSPHLAKQTGFQNEDLELFWEALINMWDLDRSASRGLMASRGLYIFSHERPTGNAPAHKLFERITAAPRVGIDVLRTFRDYVMTVNTETLPPDIVLTQLAI